MAPKPKEVKRILDELYWKTDEIRKGLISLHQSLAQSNFFDEGPQAQPHYQAPPVVQPIAPPPVMQPVVPPPVIPPQERVQPKTSSPPPPVQPVAPPPPPKPAEPQPGFLERYPDLERFIGERLVTFIGIAVLVTGIAFFVKYAIDKNWISEAGRTAIGILCGGVLLGFAHRLRKAFTAFSSVLAGGGIAVLYFTISYAFQVYALFSQETAFALLVVVTGFTVLLAVAYDRKELAVLAIVGGFATPLMVSTGRGNFNVLCSYMLVLDLGMLALAYYKKWNLVNLLSYVFTLLLFGSALLMETAKDEPHYRSAFVFASCYYLTFFLMNIVNNLRRREKFSGAEIIVLLTNTGLYYACGYFLLQQMDAKVYRGLFTLLVAAFNFIFAFALFRRQEVDRLLVYFLVGLVITFISLAGPVQLSGNHITLFWAAEAALLYWLWQRSSVPLIRVASVIINGAMLLSLGVNWLGVYMVHENPPLLPVMLNKGFVTGIFATLSLVVTSLLLKREKAEEIIAGWPVASYRATVSVIAFFLLFSTGLFELNYQLSSHHAGDAAGAIYLSLYIALYSLAAWFAIRPLGMEYLRWTVGIAVILMMIAYAFFPHAHAVHQRNDFLIHGADERTAFLFHYPGMLVIVALTLLVGRELMKTENGYREVSGAYLWLLCGFLVFVLSAELDHAVALSRFSWSPDLLSNPSLANVRINAIIEQNHKIGFPIAWGLCSFLMIMLGMRRKVRQLRIIALVLFFAAIVKLILLGIYGESQAGKIVAFILCGVILLLVSFMYQKLKKIIFDNEEQTEKETSHDQLR